MRRVGLDRAPTEVLALAQRPAGRPVVVVDGGSGAGKTSLAARVAEAWRDAGADPLQVVSLDDVYPGWDGLAAGSLAVPRIVATESPGFRRWDWTTSTPADWVPLDPRRPVLVEGCGALTRASAQLATVRVWVELDATVRKERALARDQGGFDPYWDMWAAQEQAHWRRDRPRELADLVVTPGAEGAAPQILRSIHQS